MGGNVNLNVSHLNISYNKTPKVPYCSLKPVATAPCDQSWLLEHYNKDWARQAPAQSCRPCGHLTTNTTTTVTTTATMTTTTTPATTTTTTTTQMMDNFVEIGQGQCLDSNDEKFDEIFQYPTENPVNQSECKARCMAVGSDCIGMLHGREMCRLLREPSKPFVMGHWSVLGCCWRG